MIPLLKGLSLNLLIIDIKNQEVRVNLTIVILLYILKIYLKINLKKVNNINENNIQPLPNKNNLAILVFHKKNNN